MLNNTLKKNLTHCVLGTGSDPILSMKNSLDLLRWAQKAKLLSASGQMMPPDTTFIALTTAICHGFRITIYLLPMLRHIYSASSGDTYCPDDSHLACWAQMSRP
jgi:hypothetical protein